jgi:inhibitor of cysteine peptidase
MSRTIAIDKTASGSSVTISVGDQLRVALPETPTAGFRWHVVAGSSLVYEVKDEGFTPAKALGGAGTHNWTLTALKPGTATFEMSYGRAWESSPVSRKFTLTLSVGK